MPGLKKRGALYLQGAAPRNGDDGAVLRGITDDAREVPVQKRGSIAKIGRASCRERV